MNGDLICLFFIICCHVFDFGVISCRVQLMVACVVVPILSVCFLREYMDGHNKLASLPSV